MLSKTSEVFEIAKKEIGVKEIPGEKHNARILEYHSAVTMKAQADEIAWCAAFVNWCLKRGNVLGTSLANARSFLKWGVVVKDPQIGDICVFWRGSPTSLKGHVGFYAGQTKNYILVLGGNQGNEVCIKKYPKAQLIEFRRLV